MQNIHKHLTPNDFIIIIRPIREEEDVTSEPGNWTGEVQVSIVANDKETTLEEEPITHRLLTLDTDTEGNA